MKALIVDKDQQEYEGVVSHKDDSFIFLRPLLDSGHKDDKLLVIHWDSISRMYRITGSERKPVNISRYGSNI